MHHENYLDVLSVELLAMFPEFSRREVGCAEATTQIAAIAAELFLVKLRSHPLRPEFWTRRARKCLTEIFCIQVPPERLTDHLQLIYKLTLRCDEYALDGYRQLISTFRSYETSRDQENAISFEDFFGTLVEIVNQFCGEDIPQRFMEFASELRTTCFDDYE